MKDGQKVSDQPDHEKHILPAEGSRSKQTADLEAFFDVSLDFLCIFRDGYFLRVNPALERTLGFTSTELTSKHFLEFVHPDDRERTMVEVQNIVHGAETISFENRYACKDGSYRWISWTCPAPRPDGPIYAVGRDVTAFKQSEASLRESEERFRHLADSAPVLIWQSGPDNLRTYFNNPWLEFTGRSMEEELGDGWVEGVHAEDVERCLQIFSSSIDARQEFEIEYRLKHHSGEYRWVLDRAVPRSKCDGEFEGYIGSCIDITARKQGEWELQVSEERLSLAVRTVTDGLWDCDLVEGTVWWNERYDQLYGARPKNTVDSWQWWVDRIHPKDRTRVSESLKSASNSTAEYGDCWTEEYRFSTLNGDYAHVVDRAYIARNSWGKATRILGAMKDVTVRKRAEQGVANANTELIVSNRKLESAVNSLRTSEQKLVQQERLSAIGEMASGIVHNLNNMLAPSVMLIDAILAEPELPGRVRQFAELIKTGSSDAADIVTQLGFLYGDFHSEENMGAMALKSVLEQIPALTRHKWRDEALKNGHEFAIKLAITDEPVVNGNSSDLRQVVSNLVLNAVDAMPTGGAITLRLFVDNNIAVVEVSDEGVGMSEEQQLKCFEPFFSNKVEGNGLGLSMCYGIIVKKHSGKLLVESDEGKGSTFRIELPCTEIPTQEVPVKTLPHNPSSCRILYIDDEPVVREATAAFLESAGYQVSTAESGAGGLRLFQENSFDVVISDFSMPGMNGRDVAAAIKDIRPDMPVFLATGWPPSRTATSQKTMEDCVLQKPISLQSFVNAMETWR